MTSQTCRVCGSSKALSEFHYRNETRKHRTECKCCRNDREAARRYNITVGYIEELRVAQDNSCAICGTHASEVEHKTFTSNPLVIDHNHSTGHVRGLLCPTCNVMLGHAKDDPRILQAAIAYLQS